MTGDPRHRAMIADDLAWALGLAGRLEDAVSVLETALDDLGDTDRRSPRQSRRAAECGAACSCRPGRRTVSVSRASASRSLATVPPERRLLAQVAWWSCLEGEPADAVRALAERAVAGGRLLAEVGSESSTFYCAPNALLFSDSSRASPLLAGPSHGRRPRARVGGRLRDASSRRAELSYRVGELADAEADARAALAAGGERVGAPGPRVLATLTQVLIERGQLTRGGGAAEPMRDPVWTGSARRPRPTSRMRMDSSPQQRGSGARRRTRSCGWGSGTWRGVSATRVRLTGAPAPRSRSPSSASSSAPGN